MSPRRFLASILLIVISHSAPLSAQETDNEGTTATQASEQQSMSAMGSTSPEMREMAKSMKSMADMCQLMMKREMQQRPYIMFAGAVVGTTLIIALLLFAVLEIQWIRFWNVRIKTETSKLK